MLDRCGIDLHDKKYAQTKYDQKTWLELGEGELNAHEWQPTAFKAVRRSSDKGKEQSESEIEEE